MVAKPQRRRFTAEYKRRIVREADRCTTPGAIGALLRREGLYSSHLTTWRAARDRGELEALTPRKRGPKAAPPDPRDKRIVEQEREIAKWKKRRGACRRSRGPSRTVRAGHAPSAGTTERGVDQPPDTAADGRRREHRPHSKPRDRRAPRRTGYPLQQRFGRQDGASL